MGPYPPPHSGNVFGRQSHGASEAMRFTRSGRVGANAFEHLGAQLQRMRVRPHPNCLLATLGPGRVALGSEPAGLRLQNKTRALKMRLRLVKL